MPQRKTNKGGRPPLPSEQVKGRRVTVNLAAGEHAALLKAAGDEPIGAYVRRVLLRSLARRTLAAGFALASEAVTGGSVKALILAFAPGGFAEMALVASGLGIEVTFVVVHQFARYLMVLALAPAAVFLIREKGSKNGN